MEIQEYPGQEAGWCVLLVMQGRRLDPSLCVTKRRLPKVFGGGKSGQLAASVFPMPIMVVTEKPVAVWICPHANHSVRGGETDPPVAGDGV